jgi:hypothetical protein
MALFVRQNEERSELQQRLATELREKVKQRAEREGTLPDSIEDSNFLENTKKTTSLAWVWIVIVVLVVIGLFIFMLKSNG